MLGSAPMRWMVIARDLGLTTVSLLRSRLHLFSLEWQEEKERLAKITVFSILTAIFTITALLTLSATLVLLAPTEWRPLVLGCAAVIFIVLSIWGWVNLRNLIHPKHPPFEGTLEELKRDREWLDRNL